MLKQLINGLILILIFAFYGCSLIHKENSCPVQYGAIEGRIESCKLEFSNFQGRIRLRKYLTPDSISDYSELRIDTSFENVSIKTDEQGRFFKDSIPVGMYSADLYGFDNKPIYSSDYGYHITSEGDSVKIGYIIDEGDKCNPLTILNLQICPDSISVINIKLGENFYPRSGFAPPIMIEERIPWLFWRKLFK